MSEELRWIIALLGAMGILYIPFFTINLVLTPSRMEDESNQKHEEEISSLTSERDNISARLSLIEIASPRMVYQSNTVGFVFPSATNGQGQRLQLPHHYVGEIWFINDPMHLSENTVARSVHPTIEFWDEQRDTVIFDMPGMWINAVGESLFGYNQLLPQADIEPNRRPAKLMIAIKYEADPECYGYNGERVYCAPKDGHKMAVP